VRQWIGAFSATLGGLDAIVFTAGIGERAPAVRARACEGLGFLGVEIDAAANASNAPVISTASSRVTVRVIPTDEALMMARETIALLAGKDRHVSHVPAS
jgi:acetate kinase